MKTLYFECTSGISGDMTVSSLIDLGVDPDYVVRMLQTMHLGGYKINLYPVNKCGIEALRFDVTVLEEHQQGPCKQGCEEGCAHHHHGHQHVGLSQITELIEHSGLNERVQQRALSIFRRIAQAEGKIHGIDPEQVHFHEVGAVDSIIDVVGAALCIDAIDPDRVVFSRIREGQGFVHCAHGKIPVPAPATLELLSQGGAIVAFSDVDGEMVTPTGAGIAAEFGDEYGVPCPSGRVRSIGYGAGCKDFEHPNILRTFLIETEESSCRDTVCVFEAAVDDMTGEQMGFAMEKLFDAGCVDVYFTPIHMKKNRPGQLICALCPPALEKEVTETLFRYTTSIGVRTRLAPRHLMEREKITVETGFGTVDVKRCTWNQVTKYHPEFDQVRALAQEHGVTAAEVLRSVEAALAKLSENM